MAIAMAMARMKVSALESWWRTTKLALESSRSKLARSWLGRRPSGSKPLSYTPRAPIESGDRYRVQGSPSAHRAP